MGAFAHTQQPSHIEKSWSSVAKYFQFQVKVTNVRNDDVDLFDLQVLDYETMQPIPYASSTRVFRLKEGESKLVSLFVENKGNAPLYVCSISRTNMVTAKPSAKIKTRICSKVTFK